LDKPMLLQQFQKYIETRYEKRIYQFIDLGQNTLQNTLMLEIRIMNSFIQNQVDPNFYDDVENLRRNS
jgi:hypothetical protein